MNTQQQVLFLCSANHYRSRHAEFVFNHLAQQKGLHWQARSCGFRPHLAQEPISHFVERRLEELSVPFPLPVEMPSAVSLDLLAESALVIAMNRVEHEPMICVDYPFWRERVRYWNIADLDSLSPEMALPMVESEVEQLVASLLEGHALGVARDVLVEF